MNILFLSLSRIKSIEEHSIYTDLLRKFRDENHAVTTVTPLERREGGETKLFDLDGIQMLQVKTLNIRDTHFIEKGIATLAIEYQYLKAIKKYLRGIKFDLVLYPTPPITFERVVKYVKKRDNAYTYLLLKDIFPQNAVDMNMIRKNSFIYRFFKRKERKLYNISDTIGCMSPANLSYLLKNNVNLKKTKLEVNPNSIEPIHISYSFEEKKSVKIKYGLPLDKKIFVYGGNLGIPQGLEFLMDTISNVSHLNAHILIVGNGTQFLKLKKWFESNKPLNATLLSKLPKSEYDKLLAACDIGMIFLHKNFTIPNFPSRLLSYFEMKKPVLAATDVHTDIGEIITEGNCGYWVETGDIKNMQKVIEKLCEQDLRVMGENGWKLLQNEYLVDRSYDLILEKINLNYLETGIKNEGSLRPIKN